MRPLFNFIILFLLFYFVGGLSVKATNGFTILGVSSKRPYNPQWDSAPRDPKALDEALGMSYRFFSAGGQSYIFLSEDRRYVIKLFKQKVFNLPWWFKYVPTHSPISKYIEKKKWKRSDKLERDFTSYKLCIEELPEETGLVYVHLNPTTHLNKKIRIIDRLNIEHEIDADNFNFIVQQRAEHVYDRIGRFLAEGKQPQAEETIRSILRFIVYRCQKGYHDRDPNIRTNCGFIGDQPIKIDVGRLTREERVKKRSFYIPELKRIAKPFGAWLLEAHPSLYPVFENELARIEDETIDL